MNRLFRDRAIPGVAVDSDETSAKHDSIAMREAASGWRAGNRIRFITARTLEDWLVSDWHHKRRCMGVPSLDFEPVRNGLFYSFRLGGVWVAADWWLSYFEVDEAVIPLRLSSLIVDINSRLLPLLPKGVAAFEDAPRQNARPASAQSPMNQCFSDADRCRIRAVNPKWSSWEATWQGSSACQVKLTF